MNQSKKSKVKYTFVGVTILLPIMMLAAIGAGLSGLEGINPENHGKTLMYPVSNEAAKTVKTVFAFVIVPMCVLMVMLGGLNFKYRNSILNGGLIVLSLGMISWLVFSTWALDATFVTSQESNNTPLLKSQSNDESDLRIRTIELH